MKQGKDGDGSGKAMRALFGMTGTLLGLVACGAARQAPRNLWASGQESAALDQQAALAAQPSRQQALEQLRLASMALALGKDDTAEAALRGAAGTLTSFSADGEFAAVVGAESDKEWKGEPYEKMAAFLDLGVLFFANGDRGNALAMFKSAVLADTGTAEERYRSDFTPAWVMEALAYQAENELDNARQAFDRAIDSLWSRATLDTLSDALAHVSVAGDPRGVEAARAGLSSALSAGVTAQPRDPAAAARATISWATDLMKIQADLPPKERLAALQGLSRQDFTRAADAMPALTEAWTTAVAALPPQATSAGQALQAQIDALRATPPNVVLLVEQGRGPRKVATGRYGELLAIVPGAVADGLPEVAIDGTRVAPVWLDSLSYQATTRGGRKVDSFLKGKAIFKDTSAITGAVLMDIGDAAARSDNDDLATVLYCTGCLLYGAALVTNPRADTRAWEDVPESWVLVAGRWAPGEHTLELDGRRRALVVPTSGPLVALIPALPPGGADTLGRE